MPTKRSQEFMDLKIGKASKPLIEKRRRARINQSLAQLKTLVIDSNPSENSRQTKLEKADILEMTVKHLKDIKKGQNTDSVIGSENPQKKFEKGFSECVRQVELFLTSMVDPQLTNMEDNLKKKLKDHLWRSMQSVQNPDTERADQQKELFSNPSPSPKTPAYDSPLATRSYQKRPSSVGSYDDPPVVSTIDLSFHSLKKRKLEQTEVYNCGVSQSDMLSSSSQEKRNLYNAPSYRSVTSSDTVRTYSPFDDFNADMRVPEDPMFNLSSDRSDEGRSSCSFYPTSAELSHEATNPKSNITDFHYHHQTTSPTLNSSGNHREEETFELKQKPKYDSDGQGNYVHQIPLMPRRLQNGDWALVLPGNLTLTENEVHNPVSAFRFVLPSCAAELDRDQLGRRQRSVSSPLSSSVSDMSSEEYYSRSDGEVSVKLEYDSNNDSFQCMWRPW